ncbi:AAA family ATPase [Dyella caseinilytica]|uniref:Fimbrial protein n=1 Tax=Dyella caseinilytica TaxID=1849581 RepID=A0ABX7H068_9GAMM|nr:fimbrial protein [Dyella caseinilytica]QRN55464.1 fimbrial protein [Dyella caseinilytica]GGA01907.1 pilus assembly protein CpaE [Dyella caseinilytica]
MQTVASIIPFGKLELGVKLLFYSMDEQRAQRLAARLRNVATVHWEDSRRFTPEHWAVLRSEHRMVLLDYACETADASTTLARDIHALTPDIPLIGVGSTAADRATGVLAALRAGVRDFIDMDASDDEIRTLLNHALEHAATAQAAPVAASRKPGQLVLLLGVRPGVGTSTLAAHLGALSMPTAKFENDAVGDTVAPHSLLLDLGSPHGDASLYLGAKGDFHYEDALRNASRIDATLIRTAMPRHASRLAILSQTQESSGGSDAALLIDRLLSLFELVLCDAGGLPLRHLPQGLLQATDEIWLVADQGIASMVSLDLCLRQLAQLNARDKRLSLIINRHDEDCGINARQIAERFELPLLATLPDRGRVLRSSANQGLLLHQVAPHDAYIRALAPLQAKLHIGVKDSADSSRWKRLFNRKGEHRWKTP